MRIVGLHVQLRAHRRPRIRRARHHVEVGARPLVEVVRSTEPRADGPASLDPGPLELRRVDVHELEIRDDAGAVAQHPEDGEPLGRVLEQPRVALLGRLQPAEVAQSEHEQQQRGDQHEADALDGAQHELDVVREPEQRKDPVREDDPQGGHDHVDERIAQRHVARGAPSRPASLDAVYGRRSCHRFYRHPWSPAPARSILLHQVPTPPGTMESPAGQESGVADCPACRRPHRRRPAAERRPTGGRRPGCDDDR